MTSLFRPLMLGQINTLRINFELANLATSACFLRSYPRLYLRKFALCSLHNFPLCSLANTVPWSPSSQASQSQHSSSNHAASILQCRQLQGDCWDFSAAVDWWSWQHLRTSDSAVPPTSLLPACSGFGLGSLFCFCPRRASCPAWTRRPLLQLQSSLRGSCGSCDTWPQEPCSQECRWYPGSSITSTNDSLPDQWFLHSPGNRGQGSTVLCPCGWCGSYADTKVQQWDWRWKTLFMAMWISGVARCGTWDRLHWHNPW